MPFVTGSHASRFTNYTGSKTCATCHTVQATQVHASAHYQWEGSTPELLDNDGKPHGKKDGVNGYCIYAWTNFGPSLMNKLDGTQSSGGCGSCHVGMGVKPEPIATTAQLENIDCLTCHGKGYKRHVEMSGTVGKFVPDSGITVEIARKDKSTCLSCHVKSGGGANYKRGDIEPILADPPRTHDVHMASTANQGAGFSCSDCHTTSLHRIAGRGSDLRQNDTNITASCDSCHTASPHTTGTNAARLNKHAKRINCATCHVPTYAKATPTDMFRDFKVAEIDVAKQLYDPKITFASNVTPAYLFWTGISITNELRDIVVSGANNIATITSPVGKITDAGAKIYPWKRHLSDQPYDPIARMLLPIKNKVLFETGNISQAVIEGVAAAGLTLGSWNYIQTESFQLITHGVAPKEQALSCTACHTTTNPRLPFKTLGYTLKTNPSTGTAHTTSTLCSSCHGSETYSFNSTHSRHVDNQGYNCNRCHSFSAAP